MRKETFVPSSLIHPEGTVRTNSSSDTSRCNSTDQCDAFQSLNLTRNAECREKNQAKMFNESDAILRFPLLQLVTLWLAPFSVTNYSWDGELQIFNNQTYSVSTLLPFTAFVSILSILSSTSIKCIQVSQTSGILDAEVLLRIALSHGNNRSNINVTATAIL